MSAAQLASTSVEEVGSGGIYTTAVTIEAPAPGFLCVKVVTDKFLREQKGMKVKFYPGDAYGNVKGNQIGADVTTDDLGVAGLDQRQPPGYFACLVDGITTKVRPIDVQTFAEAKEKPCLVGLPRGYLRARLLFRGIPLEGFKVRFFKAKSDGTKDGSPLGEKGTEFPSKADGVAAIEEEEFRLGNYLCEVEGEAIAAVSTVETASRPYVLSLPIVRALLEHEHPGSVVDGEAVEERGDSGGYLSVKVMFRGAPLRGATVLFYQMDEKGEAAVNQPKGKAVTDIYGVATMSSKARLGNYFCNVEGTDGYSSVSTVDDPGEPYVVAFPFVRPSLLHVAPGDVRATTVEEAPASPSGFLAVRVLFRGAPFSGRKVAFYPATPEGVPATGEQSGEEFTDREGVASLDATAQLGNYFVKIQGQSDYFSIGTVEDRGLPYVVRIPQGRPFVEHLSPGALPELSNVQEHDAPSPDG